MIAVFADFTLSGSVHTASMHHISPSLRNMHSYSKLASMCKTISHLMSKTQENAMQRRAIHVNPERSFGGTNGEPPSEASQLRKGGQGVVPRKISKTYMANGAIYVIPELYL